MGVVGLSFSLPFSLCLSAAESIPSWMLNLRKCLTMHEILQSTSFLLQIPFLLLSACQASVSWRRNNKLHNVCTFLLLSLAYVPLQIDYFFTIRFVKTYLVYSESTPQALYLQMRTQWFGVFDNNIAKDYPTLFISSIVFTLIFPPPQGLLRTPGLMLCPWINFYFRRSLFHHFVCSL